MNMIMAINKHANPSYRALHLCVILGQNVASVLERRIRLQFDLCKDSNAPPFCAQHFCYK